MDERSEGSLEAHIQNLPRDAQTSERTERVDALAASTPMLHFTLGGEHYAIEGSRVREVILAGQITRLPGAPKHIRGVAVHRRHVIGVLDIAAWLERPVQVSAEEIERLIVVEHGEITAGVCTSASTRIVNVSEATLHEATYTQRRALEQSPYARAILPIEGEPVLLLDIIKLLEDAALRG